MFSQQIILMVLRLQWNTVYRSRRNPNHWCGTCAASMRSAWPAKSVSVISMFSYSAKMSPQWRVT